MTAFLRGAEAFNQPVPFDTSSVEHMAMMFDGARAFAQPDLPFETSHATDMSYMFRDAQNFNADISSWDTSGVISMYSE